MVNSALHLHFDHTHGVSIVALTAGVVGAKAWFMTLHHQGPFGEGWCIQGFVAGFILAAILMLAATHTPIGPFLDPSAAPLLFGLGVGRLGCFFTGCCAGRPSTSRWAVWSSDRRVGRPRVPTQLMESALALGVGGIILAVALAQGTAHGALFLTAVASYTLVRQRILRLRDERRISKFGVPAVAGLSALAVAFGVALVGLT